MVQERLSGRTHAAGMEGSPEQRLSLVTLAVKDLATSTRFYRDGLGWEPSFGNEEVSFFQLNGIVLGLWRRDRMAATLGIAEDGLGPGGMEVAHNVRDAAEVQRVIEVAEAAGAKVLVAPHKAPWGGVTGHFADPDGYRWEVAWNPAWTVSQHGDTFM